VVLLSAALIAAYSLKCSTAVIATVTVLQQQLIIVAQKSQTLFWTYITTSFCLSAESQAIYQSYTITEFRLSDKSPDSELSQAIISFFFFLDKDLIIFVINIYDTLLSISFDSNAGNLLSIENFSTTILAHNSSTQYIFSTEWADRIYVDPNLNSQDSKIEDSYTDSPDIDISYIDDYSVPIICSSEDIAVADCNINLFSQPEIACDYQVDNSVCLNSAREHSDSLASLFFAACQKAAYIYPNDNETNVNNLSSRLIICCIDILCKTSSRQKFNQFTLTRQEAVNRYNSSDYRSRTLVFLLISKRKSKPLNRYLLSLTLC